MVDVAASSFIGFRGGSLIQRTSANARERGTGFEIAECRAHVGDLACCRVIVVRNVNDDTRPRKICWIACDNRNAIGSGGAANDCIRKFYFGTADETIAADVDSKLGNLRIQRQYCDL